MPISHELSGEIATALFSGEDKSPKELDDLREIVLTVYSTLEQLTRDERAARMDSFTRHTKIWKAAANAG